MPSSSYSFTFENTGQQDQGWVTTNLVGNFELDAGDDHVVQVEVQDGTGNFAAQVQVTSAAGVANCTLDYQAAAGTWSLAAGANAAFGFAYDATQRRVTLSCNR